MRFAGRLNVFGIGYVKKENKKQHKVKYLLIGDKIMLSCSVRMTESGEAQLPAPWPNLNVSLYYSCILYAKSSIKAFQFNQEISLFLCFFTSFTAPL